MVPVMPFDAVPVITLLMTNRITRRGRTQGSCGVGLREPRKRSRRRLGAACGAWSAMTGGSSGRGLRERGKADSASLVEGLGSETQEGALGYQPRR